MRGSSPISLVAPTEASHAEMVSMSLLMLVGAALAFSFIALLIAIKRRKEITAKVLAQKPAVHSAARLYKHYPKLTPRDLILIKMIQEGMTNSEMADELNISDGSLRKAKYRLKKKFRLRSDHDIANFLSESQKGV